MKLVRVNAGHPIYELLDVGIPLAWKLNRDLVADLRSLNNVDVFEPSDYWWVPKRSSYVQTVVQGYRVVWYDVDEAQIVYDLKQMLSDLVPEASVPSR